MSPLTAEQRSRLPYLGILLIAVVHRAYVMYVAHDHLQALIELNPSWLTWQYLGFGVLREELARGLLYLQQNPPIPQVLMGVALKFSSSTHALAHLLIVLQGAISAATAACMYRILDVLGLPQLPRLLLPIAFLLSIDLIVMEYSSLGQLFYENLTMLLVLLVTLAFMQHERHPSRSTLLWLGTGAAALALTRASFSYFFVVPLAFVVFRRRPFVASWRNALVLLAPVLILQGGWAAKNLAVYGKFSLSTSSWQGSNFQNGLAKRGQGEAFRQGILRDSQAHPPWFVAMTRERGLVYWVPSAYARFVPIEIRKRDREIARQFAHPLQKANSISQATVSDEYLRAYLRYAVREPGQVIAGFWQSYRLFWKPIREYSRLFVSPIYVGDTPDGAYDPLKQLAFLVSGRELGNQYFLRAPAHPPSGERPVDVTPTIPARLLTLPFVSLTLNLVNLLVVHLAPGLLLWVVLRRRPAGPLRPPLLDLAFALATYAYLAFVCSLAEYGENQRFRLAVEPLLWVVSAGVLHECWVGWKGRPERT